jgi:hypothetical protein
MTLINRNYIFKAGIFVSIAAVAGIAVLSIGVIPQYSLLMPLAARRTAGIIQNLIGHFLLPSPYVPFVTMASSVCFSLIAIILIYNFFEKTQAPEILFFAFFVLSFSFEAARIMIPLGQLHEFPIVYRIIASRILLFGRYFGLFALFAASVYAAGMGMQKQGSIILILAIAALVIALGIPIDGLSWDSSLSLMYGYASMFKMVDTGIILITMASFLVSAYTRGSREYVLIGAGSVLVSLGRSLLLGADTWITPLPALLLLGVGTWFICNQLHKVYLWL